MFIGFIQGCLVKLTQGLKWLVWDFSGLRLIWEKLSPPEEDNKKPASSFLLRVIGIYLSLYGLAVNLYDTKYKLVDDRIEFFSTTKFTLMALSN